MTRYSFDEAPDRRGSDSVKWDEFPANALPMWVADMDFRVAPAIRDALQKRLDHGVFGYELVPQSYYDAIVSWFSRRHGWTGFGREDIIPTTGVISAYSACIKAMSKPGDKVIVQSPCYNAFFPAVRNNRCVESHNTLVWKDGTYSMDFDDLERKAADPQATVLLLCNPQNPAGRVWTRAELERLGDICLRHGVFVISDEIHCELTYPGHDYTPWATLPEELVRNSASCISPTKSFNIAGIQIANIFAADPEVLRRIDRAINDNECCDVNVFGCTALEAAYNGSEEWLDALRAYLYENAQFVYKYLKEEIPQVTALPLEGTYLMWLDCRAARHADEPFEGFSERFAQHLRYEAKLILSTGTIYGADAEGFERLNIACPRKTLLEGMERLRHGFLTY
jgi:cystathionine beta-lyase